MTLESQSIQAPGNTRMCVPPFTTPSIEPEGGVRLCSAASIFNYLDETLMGSVCDRVRSLPGRGALSDRERS